MKKNKTQSAGIIFLNMLTNPIFIIFYFLFWRHLFILCDIGNKHKNLPIIVVSFLFFIVWFVKFLNQIYNKNGNHLKDLSENTSETQHFQILKNRPQILVWRICAIFVLISITVFFGTKTVNTGISYNGKLSWFLNDLKYKKTVTFKHNNVYKDGIDGILNDIDKKIDLPDKLYVKSSFDLKFAADGTITVFDTYLYGKSDTGGEKNYLISYNKKKSERITVYIQDTNKYKYKESKIIQPLVEATRNISIQNVIHSWKTDGYEEFGILYQGIRSWGYNTDGIKYIDANENTLSAELSSINETEIVNYSISIYLPGKEPGENLDANGKNNKVYIPFRYLVVDDIANIYQSNKNASEILSSELPKEDTSDINSGYKELKDGTLEFYLTNNIAYRLVVIDAALGSRFYALDKIDNEKNWVRINEDPYAGSVGVASGIKFINENLGFIILSHSGGSYGELYRTEDGGETFRQVNFQDDKLDYPDLPYEQNGSLYVNVGQGNDGDKSAIYISKDKGATWE